MWIKRLELQETGKTLEIRIFGSGRKEDSPPEYTKIGVQTQGRENCEKSKGEAQVRKTEIRNLN